MTMQEENYYDDEIDLREIVLTLLKGWKTILLMTVLVGGAAFVYSKFQTPVYEASAQVLVDPSIYPSTTTTTTLLLNETVRQKTAEIMDVSINALPETNPMVLKNQGSLYSMTVEAESTDKTLFTISVQAPSAREAMQIANAWAEAGLADIEEKALLPLAVEAETQSAQADADRALVDYLKKNNLDQLTWSDLEILTGIGLAGNVLTPSTPDWPQISSEQRLSIAALMQAKLDADVAYEQARNQSIQVRAAFAVKPPAVFNYAIAPENPVSPKTLMNTALGLVLGGMLGVFWVFAVAWWRGSEAEEDK